MRCLVIGTVRRRPRAALAAPETGATAVALAPGTVFAVPREHRHGLAFPQPTGLAPLTRRPGTRPDKHVRDTARAAR
ncbi:hypothetical protein ADK64_06895 [Streptomyces sp. MMG1121]|nr:hypothetical protein ADK64_06895 [Streptomyces sp. MMG1121]